MTNQWYQKNLLFLEKIFVFFKLGLFNVFKAVIYRLQVRAGWFLWKLPVRKFKIGKLVVDPFSSKNLFLDLSRAKFVLEGRYQFFFTEPAHLVGFPPDWFLNYLTGDNWKQYSQQHWSCISYFMEPGNDIKCIWELSRFYWMVDLAIAVRQSSEKKYFDVLKIWLQDWCQNNPVNQGVNWLCGQEAAIRLSNFILALEIINITNEVFISEFIQLHIDRILPTLHYASSQCNNHILSELTGLYVAISWLCSRMPSSRLSKIANKVEKLLTKNVSTLIQDDGSFAQYSSTYHRMVLDSLALVVCFQRKYRPYSPLCVLMFRYRLAYNWLYNMVDPVSGEAPNLGSNDGTLFFKLDSCDYRDFRPTLQLSACLLDRCRLYPSGEYDQPLKILYPEALVFPLQKTDSRCSSDIDMEDGGYVIFNKFRPYHWALLNYPKFRFRPSQNDSFHFDLWVRGVNLLVDAGTFSYNPPSGMFDLASAGAHNTVTFDNHEQMPRISRFLLGKWQKIKILQPLTIAGRVTAWCGQIKDRYGAIHQRKIIANSTGYKIIDFVSGFKSKATLRWHMRDIKNSVSLRFEVDDNEVQPVIGNFEVSRYYWKKEIVKEFSIDVTSSPANIVTHIEIF